MKKVSNEKVFVEGNKKWILENYRQFRIYKFIGLVLLLVLLSTGIISMLIMVREERVEIDVAFGFGISTFLMSIFIFWVVHAMTTLNLWREVPLWKQGYMSIHNEEDVPW